MHEWQSDGNQGKVEIWLWGSSVLKARRRLVPGISIFLSQLWVHRGKVKRENASQTWHGYPQISVSPTSLKTSFSERRRYSQICHDGQAVSVLPLALDPSTSLLFSLRFLSYEDHEKPIKIPRFCGCRLWGEDPKAVSWVGKIFDIWETGEAGAGYFNIKIVTVLLEPTWDMDKKTENVLKKAGNPRRQMPQRREHDKLKEFESILFICLFVWIIF